MDHATLGKGFFQAAKVGRLLAERFQPLSQSGIVGLDVGCVLTLVEQDNGLFLILRQGHIYHPPIQLPDSRFTHVPNSGILIRNSQKTAKMRTSQIVNA